MEMSQKKGVISTGISAIGEGIGFGRHLLRIAPTAITEGAKRIADRPLVQLSEYLAHMIGYDAEHGKEDFADYMAARIREEDGREICEQKISTFEGSSRLYPDVQKLVEQSYFKQISYVVDIPQSVLDRYPEKNKQEAFELACQDPDVTVVFNVHGWNASNMISRLKSAPEHKIDGELRTALEVGQPIVVVSIDAAGWGKSELNDLGKLIIRFGQKANDSVASEAARLYSLKSLCEASQNEFTHAGTLKQVEMNALLESVNVDITDFFKVELVSRRSLLQQAVKQIFLGRTDDQGKSALGALSEVLYGKQVLKTDMLKLQQFISTVCDRLKMHKPEFGMLETLDNLFDVIPFDELDWRRDIAYNLLNFYQSMCAFQPLDEEWDINVLGKTAQEFEVKYAPGSVGTSAQALFMLMKDGFRVKGRVKAFGHSQGVLILRYLANLMDYFSSEKKGELKFEMTIFDQEGAVTIDPLHEINYNQHLLELLRLPIGREMVKLGDWSRLTKSIGYAITHYLGIYTGKDSQGDPKAQIPSKISDEIAWAHALQINRNILPLLTEQKGWWGQFIRGAGCGINAIVFGGAHDTLTPAKNHLAWAQHTRYSASAPAFHDLVFIDHASMQADGLIPGPHYAHTIPENQAVILESFRQMLETDQLLENSEGIKNLFSRKDDLALKNLRFVAVNKQAQLLPLQERLATAYRQSLKHIEIETGLTVAVPVTQEELTSIITYLGLHKYGENLMGTNVLTRRLVDNIFKLSKKESVFLNPSYIKKIGTLISSFPVLPLVESLMQTELVGEAGDAEHIKNKIAFTISEAFHAWAKKVFNKDIPIYNQLSENFTSELRDIMFDHVQQAVGKIQNVAATGNGDNFTAFNMPVSSYISSV